MCSNFCVYNVQAYCEFGLPSMPTKQARDSLANHTLEQAIGKANQVKSAVLGRIGQTHRGMDRARTGVKTAVV